MKSRKTGQAFDTGLVTCKTRRKAYVSFYRMAAVPSKVSPLLSGWHRLRHFHVTDRAQKPLVKRDAWLPHLHASGVHEKCNRVYGIEIPPKLHKLDTTHWKFRKNLMFLWCKTARAVGSWIIDKRNGQGEKSKARRAIDSMEGCIKRRFAENT